MSAANVLPSPAAPLEAASGVTPVRVRIHDASRIEWTVAVPLPTHGARSYVVEVELEVPTSAVAGAAPWEQLQTLTRLDCVAGTPCSSDTTTDALRRGTVWLARALKLARQGFERHCLNAEADPREVEATGDAFLTSWLDAALRAARETRTKLTQPTAGDPEHLLLERALIDEFVSVRLLEMLADADRVLSEVASRIPPSAEALTRTFAHGRMALARALRDEITYRQGRGFLRVDASSPIELERYVARTARLRKHFEEVLFLERETHLVDERVQRWTTLFATLLAGMMAFGTQRILPAAAHVRAGLLFLAIAFSLAYALRERIRDSVRTWLTGKVYQYHAQRASVWRVPSMRSVTHDTVLRAREWLTQTTRTDPDPLNPEAGASLTTTTIKYVHKGTALALPAMSSSGTMDVRHFFRYDLSPLFSRLHDEVKRVPVIEDEGRVRFVDAPRRYQGPLSVRLRYDDEVFEEHVTLVLDKQGLTRVDRAPHGELMKS